MNKVDRSLAGRFGFLALVLALSSSAGSPAFAIEEDHGNPARFVENIRKGLSGISKYFWSPKILSAETEKTKKTAVESTELNKTNVEPKGLGKTVGNTIKAAQKALPKETIPPLKIESAQITDAGKKRAEPQPLKMTGKNESGQRRTESLVPTNVPKTAEQKSRKSAMVNSSTQTGKIIQAPLMAHQMESKKPVVKEKVTRQKTAKLEQLPLVRTKAANKPAEASKKSAVVKTKQPVLTEKRVSKKPLPAKAQERGMVAKTAKALPVPRLADAQKSTQKKVGLSRSLRLNNHKLDTKHSNLATKKSASQSPVAQSTPASKRLVDQAQISGAMKDKAAKIIVRKQARLSSAEQPAHDKSADKSTEKDKASGAPLKGAQAVQKPQTSGKQVVSKGESHHKGTYIWLPNKGSPYYQRYGRSGIPADKLQASGNVERTDGRWVFAPYKAGLLPGIYGLSDQINKVGNDEAWVGGGRSWIYVFDKKRTYSSFVERGKPQSKQAALSTKAAPGQKSKASQKSAALKKSGGATKKPTRDQSAGRVARLFKGERITKNERARQPGNKTQKSDRSRKMVRAAPPVHHQGKIKTAGKAARNGNWSKEKGRWIYRGKGAQAKAPAAKFMDKGLSKQLGQGRRATKSNSKGGWVFRNQRWVYIVPVEDKKSAAVARQDHNKIVKDTRKVASQKPLKPTSSFKMAKALGAGAKSKITKNDTERGAQKNKQTRQPSLAESHKMAVSRPKVKMMRNQKSWVRRNNRWVYAKGSASVAHGSMAGAKNDRRSATAPKKIPAQNKPRAQNERSIGFSSDRLKSSSREMNSSRMAMKSRQAGGNGHMMQKSHKPSSKTGSREFLFFVPGPTPGSGSWFVAPVEMLRHARKVRRRQAR